MSTEPASHPAVAALALLQAQHATLQLNCSALREQLAAHFEARHRAQEHQARAQTLQRVLYSIAERAAAGLSFYDFLQAAHRLLSELLYARNCYVCLYNRQQHTLDFPYYVDERDGDTMQTNDVPYRLGLTEYVLQTGVPQLIDGNRLARLQSEGHITEATGDLSFSTWLGVPMQIRGATGGVLAIQSYDPQLRHTLADVDALAFVANHFSSAIERYQAIDALHQSEVRYRAVVENAVVGIVVVQEGRMVYGNPSLARIVGHPLAYLLSQTYLATVHPEDRPAMVARHERRLRGEEVEQLYGFRVITQTGSVRFLELSAVTLQWNARDATLLFVTDATARVQAQRDQLEILKKQTELNQMKTRFISMTSHEFRTPLAVIHGSTELLRHYDDRMSSEKKALTLKRIEDAVHRMTIMLGNVLSIDHAENVPFSAQPLPLAVGSFCRELLDELRSASAHLFEAVHWSLDLPDASELFALDETLVRNIVGNLLSNALKYSPKGGRIDFSVIEDTGSLVIKISDQGIGIAAHEQGRLFDSFYRASNVGQIAGTGLGLAIVKASVNRHQGRMALQSALGAGSCFTVWLPLLAVQTPSTSATSSPS